MQRKTNLFYTKKQDSNFLTFSNFTEALTGNFLSTDWKVYPSRFLCLYIPALLDETEKKNFIKNYLVAYYENKLAFLRDYYAEQLNDSTVATEYDIEGDVNSLAWLFVTLDKYFEDNPNLGGYEINFIGEVTEFDYKGTYTDSICIIDATEGYFNDNSNSLKTYRMNVTSKKNVTYPAATSVLYNWKAAELENTDYAGLNVKVDNNADNTYAIYSEYNLITEETDRQALRFNVVIPLFDITNIYSLTNFNSVDEAFTLEENLEYKNYVVNDNDELIKTAINLSNKELRSINNPMGIWFADELIELKRDKESKYAPSWSLTISSQFKPFPYSNNYLNNDITAVDNQQAFQTYAQILAKQSLLTSEITNLSSRVTKLEQLVSRLNDLNNNEKLERVLQLEKLSQELQEKLDSLDSVIANKVAEEFARNAYRWK